MKLKTRLAVPAAACALALALSSAHAWAEVPYARVKPARKLTDGAAVTVIWRSFHPKQDSQLLIAQCTRAFLDDDNLQHCDVIPAHTVLVNPATKHGTTPFTVHTGTIGDGTCGTSVEDRKCLVVVQGYGGLPPAQTENAAAPIRFALPTS
jgi:hypothetical protein